MTTASGNRSLRRLVSLSQVASSFQSMTMYGWAFSPKSRNIRGSRLLAAAVWAGGAVPMSYRLIGRGFVGSPFAWLGDFESSPAPSRVGSRESSLRVAESALVVACWGSHGPVECLPPPTAECTRRV